MDMSALMDLVSSPIDGISVAGEGSEEEEGEDLGDLDLTDLGATPVGVGVLGEADEEEGEDIGDILDTLEVTVVSGSREEVQEEEGEDIGDILGELVPRVVTTPVVVVPEEGLGDGIPSVEKLSVGDVEIVGGNKEIVPPELLQAISMQLLGTYDGPLSKMKETLSEFRFVVWRVD